MREHKKDLLTKYILIDNYSDYVYGHLRKEYTLDELSSTGEFDKMLRRYSIDEIKRKLKDCLDILVCQRISSYVYTHSTDFFKWKSKDLGRTITFIKECVLESVRAEFNIFFLLNRIFSVLMQRLVYNFLYGKCAAVE